MALPARPTVDVIIEGAMRALARRGTTRLSMTDVCQEAGISRGTLYRYFSSREEILHAVSLHIVTVNRERFDRAVADDPDPEHRIRVMLRAMLAFPATFPHMRAMFEYEPKLSLSFLTEQLPGVVDTLAGYLEPALGTLPAGRAGLLTAHDLAELLYRMVTSVFLMPTQDLAVVEEKIVAVCELAIQNEDAAQAG